MMRRPDPRLLALGERLWPGLKDQPPENQLTTAADVLVSLIGLPFALAGLAWLIVSTDLALLARVWPMLLLLGALVYLLQQWSMFQVIEVDAGRYGDWSSALDGALHWMAWLTYGPTAVWLSLAPSLVDLVRNRVQLALPFTRWILIRNWVIALIANVLAPLLALSLYTAWGGAIPFPDLNLVSVGLALAAMVVRAVVGQTGMVVYLAYVNRILDHVRDPRASRRAFLRFTLYAMVGPWLPEPFGILGAGLYVESGLGVFLFFVGGLVAVGWLGWQFSRAAERSRRQSRMLERIDQLSRALLAAPPDASTLPEVLNEHLPGMFPSGRIEIRLYPDEVLARYPKHAAPAPGALWDWLNRQAGPQFFTGRAARPWQSEPADASETLLLTPILDEATRTPIGGLYQMFRNIPGFSQSLDAGQMREMIPAAQSLAAQIAAARHRARVFHQMVENQKRVQELEFAGRVQASFLPDHIPSVPGWQMAAKLDPARETSGDFYDFIELPEGRWGFVIADVADKGTGAALYMALSRTLLRTYALECYPDPAAALTAANRRLLADTRAEMFVTAFFGILDPASGQLTYCNAGHNAPLVFDGASRAVTQSLIRTGMPLGALPEAVWTGGQAHLAPGAGLVLYTDGVTEAQNAAGLFYDEARLHIAVQANFVAAADALGEAILRDIHAFRDGAPQADDITLLLVLRR